MELSKYFVRFSGLAHRQSCPIPLGHWAQQTLIFFPLCSLDHLLDELEFLAKKTGLSKVNVIGPRPKDHQGHELAPLH